MMYSIFFMFEFFLSTIDALYYSSSSNSFEVLHKQEKTEWDDNLKEKQNNKDELHRTWHTSIISGQFTTRTGEELSQCIFT